MIKVDNIREWYRLLKECREHVASVYGQRNKRQIPLYNKLDRAIKRAEGGNNEQK